MDYLIHGILAVSDASVEWNTKSCGWESWGGGCSLVLTHTLLCQTEECLLLPGKPAVPVQPGLLLFTEALGPCVRTKRHHLRLPVPGGLSDLHQSGQGNGESAHVISVNYTKTIHPSIDPSIHPPTVFCNLMSYAGSRMVQSILIKQSI